MENVYPGHEWAKTTPEAAGFDGTALADTMRWQDDQSRGQGWRAVIVRHGRLVCEWNHGMTQTETTNLASAGKAVFSTLLGIAVAEGKISSPVGSGNRKIWVWPDADLVVIEGPGLPAPEPHLETELLQRVVNALV